MSEEEKKAIDLLKEYSEDELFGIAGREALQIILNLLEKQQEEIEELKAITKTYDSYIVEKMPLNSNSNIIIADKEYFINGTFVNKFISKDKVRDYYHKICASVNHFESKNDNNIVLRIKRYLEQLLEE